MWRVLVFILLLSIAAFGAAWLAEQPGGVVVTFGGLRYETTPAIAAVLVGGLAAALLLLWSVLRFIWRLPDRITRGQVLRRRSRGLTAVSRGMIAVGAGDSIAARRHAAEASRLLSREPLALLLKAQAAQVAGDRATAEATFRAMVDNPETRVLGLRGLHVEARRRGDDAQARAYATEAARLAPAVTWANEAVLEGQCADGDWRGALETVERRATLGLIDKETARRYRAVLLTADAQARLDRDEAGALDAARDAVKLAPSLVPAAALAGRLLARRGDLRRAAKVIETAWQQNPHPDLADAYLNLRPDAARDRVARAETLAKLSSWHPEARLALAGAALEARDFERARATLTPLLSERPTTRALELMADVEEAEFGSTARVREWLARATRAPRDPAWVADGVVSDRWSPISPVTGHLDAFEWRQPPELISGPSVVDDVLLDLDDRPAEPVAIASRPADPLPTPADAAAAPSSSPEPVAPSSDAAPASVVPATATPAEHQETGETHPSPAAAARNGDGRPSTEPKIIVPDDPGAGEPADKASRFKLFG